MNNRQPPQFPNVHNYDLGFDPNEVQGQTYADAHAHAHAHAHVRAQQPEAQAQAHAPSHPQPQPQPHHHHAQLHHEPNAWHYNQYIPTTTTPSNTSSVSYSWPQTHAPFVPPIPSDPNVVEQHQYLQRPFSPTVTYHTPNSENYYLAAQAASPYAYHASPQFSGYPSPVSRSMSTGGLSGTNIDQSTSSLQPRQTQLQPTNTFLPTPRNIRFVSTDGQPHAKRRRINAACLTCRKRKTRCSGEKPVCKTCSNNGHTCAGYADKAQKKEVRRGQNDDEDDDNEDDDTSHSSSPNRQDPTIQKRTVQQSQSGSHIEDYQSQFTHTTSRQVNNNHTIDNQSPVSNQLREDRTTSNYRARVPYFRYFGPTAIVPGFKQMVVLMSDGQDHHRNHLSALAESPTSARNTESGATLQQTSSFSAELPYYNATSSEPIAPLINHLCRTFFSTLGCNYPFLQRDHFLKDLDAKGVDAILVNAVCAVSARFSSDPILAQASDTTLPLDDKGRVKRAFRGQPYAQRAISALIDTFPCPTLAVTQACLLLAYEEFGSDRDSGLWMYLGTSIRMAQDLGIQKLEGLQLVGRVGPTPKTTKNGEEGKKEESRRASLQKELSRLHENMNEYEDRKASEQERIDTFWSIFFLDRAVSSGVGRPVTLRDKDIEISFPYHTGPSAIMKSEDPYPDPFAAMIRIVHMYGRVADVLNNIRTISEVTSIVLQRLAELEKSLTGQMQQLFQDSRELSISSAKTIADILAFAELIDIKSFVGNPFTSQPMYVAACAFLAEAAAHTSQPPSRGDSPAEMARSATNSSQAKVAERRTAVKHSLLASAANQNYQRCYKALKTLGSYWAGCRYILTALDQKAKGLMDPLLFTAEDVDEMPSTKPSFTTPGWRKTSFTRSLESPSNTDGHRPSTSHQNLQSSKIDIGNAIGWSITGTANSQAPQMSLLYSNGDDPKNTYKTPLPAAGQSITFSNFHNQNNLQTHGSQVTVQPSQARPSALPYDPVSTAEADLLLGLHSPFSPSKLYADTTQSRIPYNLAQSVKSAQPHQYDSNTPNQNNDLFIQTQDVDMSNHSNFSFNDFNLPGGDMIPWLEYLPQDVLDYFGDADVMMDPLTCGGTPHSGLVPPSGPGPPT